MESCKPYLVMTLGQLLPAVYMALLHVVLDPSRGNNAIILVVYESIISVIFLGSFTLIVERTVDDDSKHALRNSINPKCGHEDNPSGGVCNGCSVPTRELQVSWCPWLGEALASATGATIMVIVSNRESSNSEESSGSSSTTGLWILGCLMNGVAVFCTAVGGLLVEKVSTTYPAILTFTTMINIFGTIQTAVAAALIERKPSSWRITWSANLKIFTIFYGGIAVTRLSFWAHIWCIYKKGPVFTTAFSPLLIVFSLMLETIISGSVSHLWSNLIGALLVVGGLYLLLWAKSKDKKDRTIMGEQGAPGDDLIIEPLLPSKA
ncbi:hypothetical protein J5N97_003478 [Dioscorea zingiberensis]|uniref:WAT1-related protein n=1 Tax=Dioscorea zingiberensis TaxID=325984 RepID=A0A9D5D681_9LILI|nr:hypothetical protein J5N97_003478 [Dioscorea zingiberensis]